MIIAFDVLLGQLVELCLKFVDLEADPALQVSLFGFRKRSNSVSKSLQDALDGLPAKLRDRQQSLFRRKARIDLRPTSLATALSSL